MFTIVYIATFSLPCQDTANKKIWALLADFLTWGKYLQEQIEGY